MIDLSKMSEDRIIDKLNTLYDEGKDGTDEYKELDAELDRRAAILVRAQERIKEQKEAINREWDELQEVETQGYIMMAMVEEFGLDFIDMYEIDNNYTVISVAKGEVNQWEHDSKEDADRKLSKLLYWRVYDNFFRNGPTRDSLVRLKSKIKEIKEL